MVYEEIKREIYFMGICLFYLVYFFMYVGVTLQNEKILFGKSQKYKIYYQSL